MKLLAGLINPGIRFAAQRFIENGGLVDRRSEACAKTASAQCHVVVIHRWRAEYVDYAAVLDHTVNRVTYITTEVGRTRVPDLAAGVEIVANTDDLVAVRRAVSALAERHGPLGGSSR